MPIFNKAPGRSISCFNLVPTGEVAEKFDDWFLKDRVIHAWNLIAEDLLKRITAEVSSWGQLRKAFPEMYDLLAEVSLGTTSSFSVPAQTQRVSYLLEYFKEHGHQGAHDRLSDELKHDIHKRKGPLIAMLKQALSISRDAEGKLDASPFTKTWFNSA